MNSRLFTEVREKRGLAYGVGAYPLSLRDAGMIRIYAGTVPQKAHETVEVTLEELRKLESGAVCARMSWNAPRPCSRAE